MLKSALWIFPHQIITNTRKRVRSERHLVIRADALHLPFKDESFDVLVASEILEHVEQVPCLLKNSTGTQTGRQADHDLLPTTKSYNILFVYIVIEKPHPCPSTLVNEQFYPTRLSFPGSMKSLNASISE